MYPQYKQIAPGSSFILPIEYITNKQTKQNNSILYWNNKNADLLQIDIRIFFIVTFFGLVKPKI